MCRFLLVWATCLLGFWQVRAQDTTGVHCGVTPEFITSLGIDTSGSSSALLMPGSFPSGAIETCGKFRVFYMDRAIALLGGPAAGFADGTVGAARRNTLCSVLTYIQQVIDFSEMAPGNYIRLYVDTSYTASFPATFGSPVEAATGLGAPYYTTPSTTGTTINGYIHQYITTGSDPAAASGGFHGYIRINFDKLRRYTPRWSTGSTGLLMESISYNNGLDTPGACQYDLFSICLHYLSHAMGWFTFGDIFHGIPPSPIANTNLFLSVHNSPDPTIASDPFGSLSPVATTTPSTPYYWLNNKRPPYNHPLMSSSLSHFEEQYPLFTRLSPGDFQGYVMNYYFTEGQMRRKFTKGELEAWHDAIGYDYKSSFASDSATFLANRIPYSSRMISYGYNMTYNSRSFMEVVAADYTITNNTGTSLTITLANDTTLKDADGDTLSVYPGSLVNFRGCGEGGNNHNRISVSSDGRVITFTPRPNFYGRAQFGFNLDDRHSSKGAFVLYTIDVLKGNNVSLPSSGNYVLNGDFEEGSEVKLKDTGEYINNSRLHVDGKLLGRLAYGIPLSDCHFDPDGVAIRNSYHECSGSKMRYGFGDVYYSFPWSWGGIFGSPTGTEYAYSDAYLGQGNRYETCTKQEMFLLADTLKRCHRYVLEFDVRRTYTAGLVYPSTNDQVVVGFTTKGMYSHPISTTQLIRRLPDYYTPAFKTSAWTHVKIPFSYCADTAATVLYLNLLGTTEMGPALPASALLLDNLVLKEQPLTVNILDTPVGPCVHKLASDVYGFSCDTGMRYIWKTISGTVVGNGRTVSVAPITTTDYILTVSDGCTEKSDTITIAACPCGPGAVFGSVAFDVIKGTVSSSIGSGYYYIGSDVTITGTPTFTGATILIAPDVTVTVDSTSKLTLDNCHLFACPDDGSMWKGIVLAAGPVRSGRIETRSNCLIEDAMIGIYANDAKVPASGNILDITNTVFNHNVTGVTISNFARTTTYPFVFKGNVFTSRTFNTYTGYPALWPAAAALRSIYAPSTAVPPFNIDVDYTRSLCKNGWIPHAGLRLTDVGYTNAFGVYYEIVVGDGMDTSYRNVFDNTGDGIYARNTNLTSYNNMFIRFKRNLLLPPVGSTLPSPLGAGINAGAIPTTIKARLVVTPMGNYYPSDNRFYDCYMGVQAQDYWEVLCADNLLQSSNIYPSNSISTGYNISSKRFTSINILQNRIYNIPTGIAVTSTSAASGYELGTVTIDKNTILAHPPSLSSSSQYVKQGIKVTGSATSLAGTVTGHVFIKRNYMQDVYNGILVSYVNKQRAHSDSNNIVLEPEGSATAQYGVSYTNCMSGRVLKNSVWTASSGGANSDKVRGFYFSNNTNTYISCNAAAYTGRGFDFIGTQPQTQWISNTMEGNLKGFARSGAIGDQINSGRSCWARWAGSWVGKSQTYASSSSATSRLFVRSAVTTPVENPTENDATSTFYRYDVASGTIGYTGVLVEGDPCNTYPFSPPARPLHFATRLGYLIANNTLDYDNYAAISNWMAQYDLYKAYSADSILNDTLQADLDSFAFYSLYTRYNWLSKIERALAEGDASTASSELSHPVAAYGRVVIDTATVMTDTVDADYIVDNYVLFYGLYVDYLQGNAVDSPTLAALAFSCPFTQGNVVYQARNLYASLYDYNGVYDEDELCSGGGARWTIADGKQQQSYSLYPNPTSGKITLLQYEWDNQPVLLTVYDMNGRQILKSESTFSNGRLSLQMTDATNGLYLLQVRDSKGRSQALRFTIKD